METVYTVSLVNNENGYKTLANFKTLNGENPITYLFNPDTVLYDRTGKSLACANWEVTSLVGPAGTNLLDKQDTPMQLRRASCLPQSGGKLKQKSKVAPKKKTSDVIKLGNVTRVVYEGPKGGRYYKKNCSYVRI